MPYQRISFRKNVSVRRAADDLITEWRKPTPYRWPILGVSVALSFFLLVLLIPESQRAPPAKPKITYITSFEPGRTEAEIVASNIANQKQQDAVRAEERARDERRKQFFRTLGRTTGLDVDALEKQYADDPAPKVAPPPAPKVAPPAAGGR